MAAPNFLTKLEVKDTKITARNTELEKKESSDKIEELLREFPRNKKLISDILSYCKRRVREIDSKNSGNYVQISAQTQEYIESGITHVAGNVIDMGVAMNQYLGAQSEDLNTIAKRVNALNYRLNQEQHFTGAKYMSNAQQPRRTDLPRKDKFAPVKETELMDEAKAPTGVYSYIDFDWKSMDGWSAEQRAKFEQSRGNDIYSDKKEAFAPDLPGGPPPGPPNKGGPPPGPPPQGGGPDNSIRGPPPGPPPTGGPPPDLPGGLPPGPPPGMGGPPPGPPPSGMGGAPPGPPPSGMGGLPPGPPPSGMGGPPPGPPSGMGGPPPGPPPSGMGGPPPGRPPSGMGGPPPGPPSSMRGPPPGPPPSGMGGPPPGPPSSMRGLPPGPPPGSMRGLPPGPPPGMGGPPSGPPPGMGRPPGPPPGMGR